MADNAYIDKARAELKKLQGKFQEGVGDIQSKAADISMKKQGDDFNRQMQKNLEAAQTRLEELGQAGEDTFEDLKNNFEAAMQKIRADMRSMSD